MVSTFPRSLKEKFAGRGSGGASCRTTLATGDTSTTPVFFARNDRLAWKTEDFSWAPAGELQDFWLENWALELTEGRYNLLIMNRGAHFVPDEIFVAELNATMAALRAQKPHLLTVFRTTVPGSYACSDYTGKKPLTNLSMVPPRSLWPYNWDKFEGQNVLARSLFREFYPHVLVLDPVETALLRPETRLGSYRGDNGDCLHWGMPGPPDLWTVALVEALALLDITAETV